MTSFLAGRLGRAVLTIWGVMTVVFLLSRLSGSPAALMLPPDATSEDVDRLNAALGLDRPLYTQYISFIGNALRGDLGNSTSSGQPALSVVLERLPATFELAITGFVVGITLGFGAALLVQLTDSQRLRTVFTWLGTVRQAMPTFLFGVLMVLVFSVWGGWFPSMGYDGLSSLVLPAITLGTFELALYLRLLDAGFAEQEPLEYVRTAHAKGQARSVIVVKHMLPNALLPVLTIAGLHLGALLGGSAVIETVFNWPGAGQLIIQAVRARDFPVVQAGFLVICLIFVFVNLAVDLLYSVIDPRVRV